MGKKNFFFTAPIIILFLQIFNCGAFQNEIGPLEHGKKFLADPINLLTPPRLDVVAKYIYAKHKEKNVHCNWALELYKNHLYAVNRFYEGSPRKRGFNDFLKSFCVTLESIKQKGFDPNISAIPVDKYLNPRNGAHRVGACILYNCRPTCQMVNPINHIMYLDENWLKQKGLEQKYLDDMALTYCTLKKNTYIAMVMPVAIGKDSEIKEIFDQYGMIVYQKKVFLNWNGAINLVCQAYKGEPWLGNFDNSFAGAQHKARCCFPQDHRTNNPLRVFLFECSSLEKVRKCKEKIRELFSVENHSIHVNDTHEQAIIAAQSFFVQNSIHFLNHAKPREFKNFLKFLEEYKNWIHENNIDPEDLCIESGAVLSAYGIRDCGDIDFLHNGYENILPTGPNLESHNKHHSIKNRDNIIYNPENHFWYEGVKFKFPQKN